MSSFELVCALAFDAKLRVKISAAAFNNFFMIFSFFNFGLINTVKNVATFIKLKVKFLHT